MKNDEKLLQLHEKRFPYTVAYFRKYGMDSGLIWNKGDAERIYKECLEKGITWEERFGTTKEEILKKIEEGSLIY